MPREPTCQSGCTHLGSKSRKRVSDAPEGCKDFVHNNQVMNITLCGPPFGAVRRRDFHHTPTPCSSSHHEGTVHSYWSYTRALPPDNVPATDDTPNLPGRDLERLAARRTRRRKADGQLRNVPRSRDGLVDRRVVVGRAVGHRAVAFISPCVA